MLQQIDFGFSDGREYCILYDDEHMTEEQAKLECEFIGWGGGHDKSLYPHYIIVDIEKKPILKCIKNYCMNLAYESGYDKGYDVGYETAADFYGEENYK